MDFVRLAMEGLTNQEISEREFVCLQTVKHHFFNIYKKLGIKSRSQLMLYFVQYPLPKVNKPKKPVVSDGKLPTGIGGKNEIRV